MKLKRHEDGQAFRLLFMCPGCTWPHGPTIGPGDGPRWTWNGDMERPTFQPSLLVRSGSTVCHSFVRDGRIEFLADCTHALAGQTVELPEFSW